jgi:hypothetical protein
MKKALVGIMISVMMLVTLLPITALAFTPRSRTDPATAGLLDHTTIRGFALNMGMSRTGAITHLFAIRLHYTTITLSGEYGTGVLRFRPIDVPTKSIGYRGHVYIFASFRGSLNV